MGRYKQRCALHRNKTIYPEEVAKRRSSLWKADSRGEWNAYKCRHGNHWHVGHNIRTIEKEPNDSTK